MVSFYIMTNHHFQRKIASDELYDTLFFATGERPLKSKTEDLRTLDVTGFKVKIMHFRNIVINGDRCHSVAEAKYVIQDLIQ